MIPEVYILNKWKKKIADSTTTWEKRAIGKLLINYQPIFIFGVPYITLVKMIYIYIANTFDEERQCNSGEWSGSSGRRPRSSPASVTYRLGEVIRQLYYQPIGYTNLTFTGYASEVTESVPIS